MRNRAAVAAAFAFLVMLVFVRSFRSLATRTRTRSTSRRSFRRASTIRSAPTSSAVILRPHGAGRPRLDRNRLRSHNRDHARRDRLRRDVRLRRRVARQRDDALPRRPVRLAVPPFAILTLRDLRAGQLLDDGRGADRRLWFTTARVMRGQIISLKENDYVRAAHALGARWYRSSPAPASEHARRDRDLRLPRTGRGLGEALRSSASGSTRRKRRGARWHRTGTPTTRRTYIIASSEPAIAWLIISAFFIADGLRDALDPRTRQKF